MKEYKAEILIVGAGLGGVAAALSALRLGREVILTEETDWIGGQLTAQAVPPDEHPWIESAGCTASYRRLREEIRSYYRNHYPLLAEVRQKVHLNPGMGYVSPLCHEPRVALAVLQSMLAPYLASRKLRLWLHHKPTAAETDRDRVLAVQLVDTIRGSQRVVRAEYILDATEFGDLLDLAEIEHVIGAESQAQTGEPNAVMGDPQPLDQQAVTWCFTMDYLAGEDHTTDKPEDYAFWQSYQAEFWPGKQLGWTDVDPITLAPRYRAVFDSQDQHDFWHYRRILNRSFYPLGSYESDITLVNWPQIDYWLGPMVGVPRGEVEKNLRQAEQLSRSFLYWMQTEAPRPDGGLGYPGLRLRSDITGTIDGLAKYVYVRESRRIKAEFTVLEQHVGVKARQGSIGAELFHDSVGIGSYRIDLHPSTGNRTYVDISSWPFQIPLGALIPVRVENLLPACKNLGVTHITNGCYRLHPVEWNIGEAAGALAAYCLENKTTPRLVRNTRSVLADFQQVLINQLGFELSWPEYARITPR